MQAFFTISDRHSAPIRALFVACTWLALLSACGDNGGSSGSGRITYTVSGSANATSSGLEIELNGGSALAINANQVTWTFPEGLEGGGTGYTVAVKSNPQAETCTVQNGSGRVSESNIVGVAIVCTANHYTIGGIVTGFTGSGLVLEDTVSGERYKVTGNGSFAITPGVTSGTVYNVIADTSDTSPFLNCPVQNGSNTVGDRPVTVIVVNCSVAPFNIGGSITGLEGSNLVITETVSGLQVTPIAGATSFTFTNPSGSPHNFPSGSRYNIDVRSPTHTSNPYGLTQNCSATNATGTVKSGNVNIQVTCYTQAYQLSGTIVLPAAQPTKPEGLILTETISGVQANINSPVANPTGTGYLATFSFPFPATGNPPQSGLLDGSSFSVSIQELESTYVNTTLHCLIDGAGATGMIAGQNYSTVVVKCRPISSYLESAGPGSGGIGGAARDCWGIDQVSGQLTMGQIDTGKTTFNPLALISGASSGSYPTSVSNFFYAYVDVQGSININRSTVSSALIQGTASPDCIDGEPTVINDNLPGAVPLVFGPAMTGTLYAAIGFSSFAELDRVNNFGFGSFATSSSVLPATGNNGNKYFPGPTSLQFDASGNNAMIFYSLPFNTLNQATSGFNDFTLFNRTNGSWAFVDETAALNAGGFGTGTWSADSSISIGENIYVLADNYEGCDQVDCYGDAPASAPRIVGYSLNSASGALTILGGSPYQDPNAAADFGASLLSWCYDPTNLGLDSGHTCSSSALTLIFLVNESTGIDVFEQTTSGSLTRLTTSPVVINGVEGISSVVIDPSGKFLYAYALTTSNVVAFRINPSMSAGTQLLTLIGTYAAYAPVSVVNALMGANAMVIDNSGKFLYVIGTQLSGFRIDPNTGVLTPTAGSPYSPSLTTETMLAISMQ